MNMSGLKDPVSQDLLIRYKVKTEIGTSQSYLAGAFGIARYDSLMTRMVLS